MAPNLTIYRYDEYFCFTFEDRRPGEATAHGDCVYVIPPHATIIEPDFPGEDQVPVYDPTREKWQLLPDHRGETWFTATGIPVEIKRPGDPVAMGYRSLRFGSAS
jgi:hypothetical protein